MAQSGTQNPFSTYNHLQMKQKIGVSGLKIFDGEDLTSGNRKRLQQLQQKDWIDQQIREKQERKQLEKETDQAYQAQASQINHMVNCLDRAEKEKRNDMTKAAKQTNQVQVMSHLDKHNFERQQNQDASRNHIQYCLTNDFQTENTQTCQSELANHRVKPYHWKGMNDEQKQNVLLGQEQQRAENEMMRKLQKDENKMYDIQTEKIRMHQVNLDRERERQLRGKIIATKEYNLKAQQEHTQKIANLYGGN